MHKYEPQFELSNLTDAKTAIRDAIRSSTNNLLKAVLQRLVAEIRIGDRKSVKPTFKVPMGAVRIHDGLAGDQQHHDIDRQAGPMAFCLYPSAVIHNRMRRRGPFMNNKGNQ